MEVEEGERSKQRREGCGDGGKKERGEGNGLRERGRSEKRVENGGGEERETEERGTERERVGKGRGKITNGRDIYSICLTDTRQHKCTAPDDSYSS